MSISTRSSAIESSIINIVGKDWGWTFIRESGKQSIGEREGSNEISEPHRYPEEKFAKTKVNAATTKVIDGDSDRSVALRVTAGKFLGVSMVFHGSTKKFPPSKIKGAGAKVSTHCQS